MILGMSLATFVTVHVIISLVGIVAGIIVMFGMLGSNRMPGLTAIFLLFTILTSATGFLFPFEKLLPLHIVVRAYARPGMTGQSRGVLPWRRSRPGTALKSRSSNHEGDPVRRHRHG